ncbi:MAG: hypothetical protein V2A73_01140, partial [Pseudomonadota bacterium]
MIQRNRWMSVAVLAVLAILVNACAPISHPLLREEALRGLRARQDPQLDLDDDEDLERARSAFRALDAAQPEREQRRRELLDAHAGRVARSLDSGDADRAFEVFEKALTMWNADELDAPDAPPPGFEPLVGSAERLFAHFSRTGAGNESIAVLAFLAAAFPSKANEHLRTFEEIARYLDELGTAEYGEGAKGARTIATMESAIRFFPSAWVGEKLVQLYLDRQAAVQLAIQNPGTHGNLIGAHREGIMRPVWNLVRTFARLGRLDDAVPVVDRLANQFGDQPDLRELLRSVLATDASGPAWLALAAAFAPRSDHPEWPADLVTVADICEEGMRRVPQ